ncbi:MAG: T9SS type A sorting domain-containing protein [Bacteroidota bacterium]
MRVKFPGGQDTTLTGIAANQLLEITEAMPTGTAEAVSSFQLSVSPNPSSDTFTISLQLQQPKTLTLRLSDSGGRVIFEKKTAAVAGDFSENFSRKGLAAGQYFLTVQAGEEWRTVAVSIQ